MQEKTVELLEKVATILKVVVGVRVFANRKDLCQVFTHIRVILTQLKIYLMPV